MEKAGGWSADREGWDSLLNGTVLMGGAARQETRERWESFGESRGDSRTRGGKGCVAVTDGDRGAGWRKDMKEDKVG